MTKWEQVWADIRRAACEFWTKGEHDLRDEPGRWKCRICGVVRLKPPAPPPIPDPPVPDEPDDPPAPPVDPSGEPNPANPRAYAAGFLWKPQSESSGQLVVLAPEAFTGHIAGTWLQFNGLEEKPYGGQVANGNRYHSRFSKAGGAYPSPTSFRIRTDANRVWTWTVTRTGSRNGDSGEIVPTVVIP